MEVNAIIVDTKGSLEVRCKSCGKLLFVVRKSCFRVDKKARSVTIVARCTRCKSDNVVAI